MKKVRMLLMAVAVTTAIGGAFATTIQLDPCDDPAVEKYTPEGASLGMIVPNCTTDITSPFCYTAGPDRVECHPGGRLQQ